LHVRVEQCTHLLLAVEAEIISKQPCLRKDLTTYADYYKCKQYGDDKVTVTTNEANVYSCKICIEDDMLNTVRTSKNRH
jgi:hypothetical protein